MMVLELCKIIVSLSITGTLTGVVVLAVSVGFFNEDKGKNGYFLFALPAAPEIHIFFEAI